MRFAGRPILSEAPVTSPAPVFSGHGVNNLGYRAWNGEKHPGWKRWMVIAAVGVRRAWTSSWLKRMMFLAWLPAVWFSVGFFIWEQAALYPEWRQMASGLIRGLPPTPALHKVQAAIQSGELEPARHTVWALLLQGFFRYPQAIVMVLVVGMIAPPLISQDIRSRAFLIYFSRPLVRAEYVVGKMATLWIFLSIISSVPALILYFLGVLLSPNIGVIAATWDLPFRIVAASMVLMIPTSVLALCYSSLTQESRYAGFAWFITWILGWVTYMAATAGEAMRPRRFQTPEEQLALLESSWTNLSLYHTLGKVQSWVFGFSTFEEVLAPIVILSGITVVSLMVLLRRISAPMRV
jgi:ABC-2 type transport system permease protein